MISTNTQNMVVMAKFILIIYNKVKLLTLNIIDWKLVISYWHLQ